MTWQTSLKLLSRGCEVCEEQSPAILVKPHVDAKIRAITNALESHEWLGYLLGTKQDDLYFVDNLYVPKQTVKLATVEVEERYTAPNILGTVHSHHGMGAFFSGPDKDMAANHDITVVTSGRETKAKARVVVPCGRYTLMDAEYIVDHPTPRGVKQFAQEAVNKFTFYTYTPPKSARQSKFPIKKWKAGIEYVRCESCQKFCPAYDAVSVAGILICGDCLEENGGLKNVQQLFGGGYNYNEP